ncbi:aspartate carbamoyltransferase [Streptomyces fructofermentans]|uniref:aspartate carbamoyltransferase n=1 Tax=Streptomyces fructofermentans TaxID=152141 RepID=UPI0033E06FE7
MHHGKRRLLTISITTAGIGAALGAALWLEGPQPDSGERQRRQQAVAERGRTVMPFDLDQTTHHFTPTATGGTQDVVADRSNNARQVALIRSHLKQEAMAFTRGDFGDPAQIHGAGMPGLKELESGHERIDVSYRERPDGATLTYTTEEPALIDALHDWFTAQLSDHGNHAEGGH